MPNHKGWHFVSGRHFRYGHWIASRQKDKKKDQSGSHFNRGYTNQNARTTQNVTLESHMYQLDHTAHAHWNTIHRQAAACTKYKVKVFTDKSGNIINDDAPTEDKSPENTGVDEDTNGNTNWNTVDTYSNISRDGNTCSIHPTQHLTRMAIWMNVTTSQEWGTTIQATSLDTGWQYGARHP